MKISPKFAVGAVSWLMRGLGATLRIQFNDRAGYFDASRKRPCIVSAWHNRILVLPICFGRLRNVQRLTVLTSASRDGELLAGIVRRFGLGAVRGSSSRRGAAALRELSAELDSGADVIITPDGPRGPRYTLSPGIIFLAQKTGLPLMRVQVDYERYWELKSWDRFRIPKPFSKLTVTLHPFETLEFSADDDSIEAARRAFEARMREDQAEDMPEKVEGENADAVSN